MEAGRREMIAPLARGNVTSGDCPTNGYVVPDLKIRTKRLVHDGRKLRRLGVVRPNSSFRGDGERWRLRS
jgi:hypothetical protein